MVYHILFDRIVRRHIYISVMVMYGTGFLGIPVTILITAWKTHCVDK